jgi:hypothetical protein
MRPPRQRRGGERLGLHLAMEAHVHQRLLDDAKGDCIDAAICLVQAAWGAERHRSAGHGYGLPMEIDPVEGWIVTA